MSKERYRVKIEDKKDGNGAHRTGESLGSTVLGALKGSLTYTEQAFVIDLVAHALVEGVFENSPKRRQLLEQFLRADYAPMNCQESVNLALEES